MSRLTKNNSFYTLKSTLYGIKSKEFQNFYSNFRIMKVIEKGKYLGVNKSEQSFNEILLSKTHYPEGLQSDWHYHENPYFTLILDGGSVEVRRNETIECVPGQVFFYNWQEPHKNFNYKEDSKNFNIELDANWIKKSGVNENAITGICCTTNPDVRFLITKVFKEFLLNDNCSSLSVNTLTLELFGKLTDSTHSRNMPPWMNKLLQILNDQWSENFSLHELSGMLNVHPITISKYFPKYNQCTLGEYVRKIRTNKSLDLIRSTKLSLSEIAFECGFADQSHFIRNFKQHTGFLPKAFQQINNNSF